ncbi:MAG: PilZ domain-containing protein, partial [Desulfuromonadales bacterium]|nr:PilZ domain-containing protein [Desulfuromonadales bacterium]
RSERRRPVEAHGRFAKTGGKWRAGDIHNLSTGGLFLAASHLFPVDTPLMLEFCLPPGDSVSCQGRVAWVNHPEWIKNPGYPAGMGVQFLDLEAAQRQALTAFLGSGEEIAVSP